jgi:hypothetical protein
MIRRRKRKYDDPLLHPDHKRPRTRREFLSQGFIAGSGAVMVGSTGMTLGGRSFALSGDLPDVSTCGIAANGAGKVPFICFDLAGGSNQAGSNVLVGQQGGQLDFLSTMGYERQGLPGDMVPPAIDPTTQTDHVDQQLGLAFHSDSAFLRGMLDKMTPATIANVNGAVIPARSDNDTGNNPHNPMYGIARAGMGLDQNNNPVIGKGADGSLLTLIGSENSDSGGNSMAPADLIDLTIRPTKVDRPSDVTGLVDVGDIAGLGLTQADAVAVMESIYRISEQKMNSINNGQGTVTTDQVVQDLVKCGYLKTAHLAEEYGDPSQIDPAGDPDIVGPIFDSNEFLANDRNGQEFRKTASIMKMVVNGFAGAGTVEMGGYDYHGGARAEGEYARLRTRPLMLYEMSDGSLSSNGVIDNTADGRGKGEWTSDNSSTAATFFLVYNPTRRPDLIGATAAEEAIHQQIGFMRPDGSVETSATPAANNVNLLVQTVLLNYMALHNEHGLFGQVFGNSPVTASQDLYTAFEPIFDGTIFNPLP